MSDNLKKIAMLVIIAALICLILLSIGLTVYGLYVAFSASIVLGLVALVLEPSPLVFGIVMFFFDKNLPEMILQWLSS